MESRPAPSRQDRDAFYAAALVGLRALDTHDGTRRRLGTDADRRWAEFQGALGPEDRIDLLLRDAAVTWGPAFSPAQSFGLFGLAEDEPFGPDWQPLTSHKARSLLTTEEGRDLTAAARALGIRDTPVTVPSLAPATRLVVAGGSAILAVALEFARRDDLSWSDQVAVVADRPAHRQLAGLAAVMVGAARRTSLVRPDPNAAAELHRLGFAHPDAAVVSADATPEARDVATRAAGGR